jgi:hypothetical protein
MKPIRWACFSVGLLAMLLALCASAYSQTVRPRQADVVFSEDAGPPGAAAAWRPVDLPLTFDASPAWFRVEF